ncbi:MAG: hypothetical protein ABI430_04665 [Candidatus Taylorbacteria bacterium]
MSHFTQKNTSKTTGKSTAGFTILYAVLVSVLLLSIGVSIYSISLKQYLLSSSAIDSQISMNAANAGLECALYWDNKQRAFKTDIDPDFGDANNGFSPIICNNISISPIIPSSGTVTTFQTGPDTSNAPCAKVTVTKSYIPDCLGVNRIKTEIISDGYNYCSSHPQKVERSLRAEYPNFVCP